MSDKTIFGAIGAVVGAAVVAVASLFGGGDSSPPDPSPPVGGGVQFDCHGWEENVVASADFIVPSCVSPDKKFRVFLTAEGAFSHGAPVDADGIPNGEFIFDPRLVPSWER